MGIFGKVIQVVVGVLVVSTVAGYAEYRLKGGEPIRKVYKQVKEERLRAEAVEQAKKQGTIIKATGTVN